MINLVGGGGFGVFHIDLDKTVPPTSQWEQDAGEFFNSCSLPMLDGDFSRGVIICESETWAKRQWEMVTRLQCQLARFQVENFNTGRNGGGGGSVAVRICMKGEGARIFHEEVEKRREVRRGEESSEAKQRAGVSK